MIITEPEDIIDLPLILSTTPSTPPPPTPNSNYLVDERIMFGWYPTLDSEGLYTNGVGELINVGRTVFVNLTTVAEKTSLFKYLDIVTVGVPQAIFINYPIADVSIPTNMESF